MEHTIFMRKGAKRSFIEACTAFYIKQLKLDKSKYKLLIVTKKGLSKTESMSGLATELPDKNLVVFLDSGLSWEKMLTTLAHEMVHVKQMATGKLKYKTIKGNTYAYWNGKRVVKDYTERPWEHQAWSQELILANRLMAVFNTDIKKF